MCGIAGLLDTRRSLDGPALLAAARAMGEAVAHRGPDDSGEWADPEAGVALAHRRLSIVDLSPEGHQPMVSADGRWWVAFNGEIYNHLELRAELEVRGHRFRGHSDTEVLLALVQDVGVEAALPRFNGMFALAFWDRRDRRLHLARDRFGEKPLYYGWLGRTFLFGSELKALRAHPAAANLGLDVGALALYLRHGYVPGPHAIHPELRKLPPANHLVIHPSTPGEAEPRPYWSMEDAARRAEAAPFRGTEDDGVAALDALLRDAIRLRMHADVPLGAFLSGGIDSSTVVALMQAQSTRPVRTFTVGFADPAFDEAEHARVVAAHLGTQHTALTATPADALAMVPSLPTLWDEPFADASQVPTALVARLARAHVTVTLSGDAGDELLGGYGRYLLASTLWRSFSKVPGPVRVAAAALLGRFPGFAGRMVHGARRVLARGVELRAPAVDQGARLARLIGRRSFDDLYRELVSTWGEPGEVAVAGREPPSSFDEARAHGIGREPLERMMYWDTRTYLPDDILVKVDRASMAVALESRVPLLDHRLFELAWSLPLAWKVRDGKGKHLLRRVLDRYVPRALVERPKRGFAVPVDAWLRGPLRGWMTDLLSEERLRRQGLLREAVVGRHVREHLAGARDHGARLWTLLMFQAWMEARERRAPARAEAPPPGR